MLVVVKNAENTLLQELRSCWESFPSHRCLYLKCSQLEQGKEEWFPYLSAALKSFLDDTSAKLYLCHDNDVFVLCRTLTQKRVDEFLTHLFPILAPAPVKGLAALFEIGVDWSKLRVLCEKKIENIKLQQSKKQHQAKKKEEFSQLSCDETLKTLNKDLISSLPMRRTQRETPEIMIVEDDPFSQKLVGNALKGKYPISITNDGQGAIMSYVKKAPDVLFLDIGLPDIDGHEVLEKLFKFDPDAYVVMFSGNGDKENIMKAVELGAKGFVGKPFTQEKLLQYIQKSPFIQEKQNKEKTHGNLIH